MASTSHEMENPNPIQESKSWADKVAIEEEAQNQEVVVAAKGSTTMRDEKEPRNWVDVAKGNRMNLQFIPPGISVKFTQGEWEDGYKSWKHAVVTFKSAFAEVQRWVGVNWKAFNPKVAHIKLRVYMFEFQSEEDKIAALSRKWTFYQKSPVVIKS